MKYSTLLGLFCLLFTFQSYSQISIAPRHIGRLSRFENNELSKFKNTETIFVLSSFYSKDVYEKILKESWTVTPFKVVDLEDFEQKDYFSSQYSIVAIGGLTRTVESTKMSTVSTYVYVDFKIYDGENIRKEVGELSSKIGKKKRKKKTAIIKYNNTYNIARFYLFPKKVYVFRDEGIDNNEIYTDDVFFNYNPGFLKNYFQKINSLIENNESYWMYEKEYLPALKALAKKPLYIPSYISIKYNGVKGENEERDHEYIDAMFKKYDYDYTIISDQELSDKIMKNEEEFYYLRYARENVERFLQVVNSRTGEVVYRDYIAGIGYKIKSKHISSLSSKIKKSTK